jgi:hypothetical protein
MFHPLLPNMSEITDSDVESKISELNKKYVLAARFGNGGLCSQLLIILEQYRDEQQRRLLEKTKKSLQNQNTDLGDLIKVN